MASEERELKFPGVELGALRERLAELGAERTAPSSLEDNLVFDREGELAASGRILRLRNGAGGATLTFKGPVSWDGPTKVREEHETGVADAPEAREVLEAMGFELVRRYQKMREEWRLGGVTICLDHTPIGDFVEFEGSGCDKVARRCGFDLDTASRKSYLQLYESYREQCPEAPHDMLLPE